MAWVSLATLIPRQRTSLIGSSGHVQAPPCRIGQGSLHPGGAVLMQLWHLIPIDLQAAAWQATVYKGPVVVRAETEQQARELACSDFSDAGLPIATTTDPPWSQPEVVRAEPIEDDLRYSAIGGPEVLELR